MGRREATERQSVSVKGEDIETLTLSVINILDQGINEHGIRDDDRAIMLMLSYMTVLNFLPHGLPVHVVDNDRTIDIREELAPSVENIEHVIRLSPTNRSLTKKIKRIAAKIGMKIDEYLMKFEETNSQILGHIPAVWSIIMFEMLKQSEYESIAVLFPAKDKEKGGQRGYLSVYLRGNFEAANEPTQSA